MQRQLSFIRTMPFISESRSWRQDPDRYLPEVISLARHIERAQEAERAGLDAVFYVDFIGLNRTAVAANPHPPFEPLTILAAVAAHTSRIGLIGTASTMFTYPFGLARQFASLEQISGGRSGWNAVTSFAASESFGYRQLPAPQERYAQAQEVVDAVGLLWDSWADDAIVGDAATGLYVDPARIAHVSFHGEHVDVEGGLDLPRSPQGRPVIFQAGASADGIAFAGRNAEAIFAATPNLGLALEFAASLSHAAEASGRTRDDVRILPGVHLYIRDTVEEAWAAARAAAVTPHRIESILADLDVELPSHGLRGLDPDRPIPADALPSPHEIARLGARRSRVETYRRLAYDGAPTYREFLERSAISGPHAAMIGTPETVADEMAEWLGRRAADGFTLLGGDGVARLDETLFPVLRQRGLFRTEYTGATLREHLALPRPLGVRQAFPGRDVGETIPS
jgi:FMN-dependent oxidoreductase (nitrilotriacetate monooxygenase family)